jgi:PAS domain S-box-containing protein
VVDPLELFDQRDFLEAIPDGILLVDAGGTIRWGNSAAAEVFGWPIDELVGQPVEILIPGELRADHVGHRTAYMRAPTRRLIGEPNRFQALHRDGTSFVAQILLAPVARGEETYVIVAARDMSDWLAHEHGLAVAQRRVALAEDRDRIGRNLHDTVIQELFGLGMSMQSWISSVDDATVRERLGEAITTIDQIIREIRATIFGLHEAVPGEPTFTSALHDLVNSAHATLGFTPRLVVEPPDVEPPAVVAEHLLPTVREALANVAKHARAGSVVVHLRIDDGRVRLTVTDDGVGIPAARRRAGGLDNLARRAAILGGRLTVQAHAGGGTELCWEVPFVEGGEQHDQ